MTLHHGLKCIERKKVCFLTGFFYLLENRNEITETYPYIESKKQLQTISATFFYHLRYLCKT